MCRLNGSREVSSPAAAFDIGLQLPGAFRKILGFLHLLAPVPGVQTVSMIADVRVASRLVLLCCVRTAMQRIPHQNWLLAGHQYLPPTAASEGNPKNQNDGGDQVDSIGVARFSAHRPLKAHSETLKLVGFLKKYWVQRFRIAVQVVIIACPPLPD